MVKSTFFFQKNPYLHVSVRSQRIRRGQSRSRPGTDHRPRDLSFHMHGIQWIHLGKRPTNQRPAGVDKETLRIKTRSKRMSWVFFFTEGDETFKSVKEKKQHLDGGFLEWTQVLGWCRVLFWIVDDPYCNLTTRQLLKLKTEILIACSKNGSNHGIDSMGENSWKIFG